METARNLEAVLSIAGIPALEAGIHANRIHEGLQRFPIKGFQLLEPEHLARGIAIVEYAFGNTGYSIDKAKPSNSPHFFPTHHGGTQCDRENLLYLARAFEIAAIAAPEMWVAPDADLVGKLTSARQHLDTLNEFWWLSRWICGFKAKPNYKLNPNCSMDVDWRLSWSFWNQDDFHIYLEVKRRICDVLRSAQGHAVEPAKVFEAGLKDDKGRSKFVPSRETEINVLAVTLIGEIDRDVQDVAARWLTSRDDIDALLLFSRFSVRKSGFDCQIARKNSLLKHVMNPDLSSLDESLHGRVYTPIGIPLSQFPLLP